MPASREWIEYPLDIVQRAYAESGSDYIQKTNEVYSQCLLDSENTNKIPSLNDVPLHILKADSLVRFRCIIQDMFEPEIYLSEYESVNKSSGQSVMRSGRYKDVADCRNEEEVQCDSRMNVMSDRQVYYCVPVPAETTWVKKGYSSRSAVEPRASTSGENQSRDSVKRTYDDKMCPGSPESVISSTCSTLNEDSDACLTETETETEEMETTDCETRKRTKINNNDVTKPKLTFGPNLNFPLADEDGTACIVKVYEQEGDALKVTDMMEFIGVLSIDPAMNAFHEQSGEPSIDVDAAELMAHSPPPSLVPRLHCIVARRLNHNNPLVHRDVKRGVTDKASAQLLCEARHVRTELLSILEQMLFGDSLAAEYLLCHLLSSVYGRRDMLALGKFSVNLSNSPKTAELAEYLTILFRTLLTKVHLLPLSLPLMNARLLSPKKDYQANRVEAGALQTADNTELVVDETALEAGQLNDTGVKNVTALGNLIQWQKVEYDLTYHKTDFLANTQVLVISEGKSLLPTDCRVHLTASGDTNTIRERYSAVTKYLTPYLLDKIRAYITVIQNTNYRISDQMQKVLGEHFVESRKEDPKSLTTEDFNVLFVLTRLMSLSYGETDLSLDVWNRVREMEKERLRRLAATS